MYTKRFLLYLKVLCILSILDNTIWAQNKQDYVWFTGRDIDTSLPGHQILHLDFNQSPAFHTRVTSAYNFHSANVSICDREGRLMFYSNGCMIANALHEVMPNGEGINDNDYYQNIWNPDCKRFGYPSVQNNLILPDPARPRHGFYVLHKIIIWEPEIQSSSFMRDILYTYIDMSLENGNGDVTSKNQLFYTGDMLQSNYFTAMTHANGRDWWILQPTETGKYLTFLLDISGIHLMHIQNMGDEVVPGRSSSGGTSSFSPDGTKFAYYNAYNNLLLYDFDRETGILSNFKKIIVREVNVEDIYFSSVEWSPNSRFIYTASKDKLHQVDTQVEPIESGIELIDIYDGTRNPFPNTFFLLNLGPDCRIYLCSTNGNLAYHVIHHPNRKGKACHFVQNGIQLTQYYSNGSFPNFPRWRVDEEEKCDPSIATMFGEPIHYVRKMQVWPTPATYELYLDIPENISGDVYILDMQGKPAMRQRIDHSTGTFRLDISGLVPGGYIVEFYPSDPSHRLIWSGKVVVSGR